MKKNIKERIVGASGSVSGLASVLGSWQVCHNVCLGIIAVLSIIGISIVGMPLEFLTKLAVPFWSVAMVLLGVTIFFYVTRKCISSRLIMFNSGLLIAGVPFQPVQQFSTYFMVVGGLIAITGVSLYIKDKLTKKRCCHGKNKKDTNIFLIVIAIVAIALASGFIITKGIELMNPSSSSPTGTTVSASDNSGWQEILTGTTGAGDVAVGLKPHKPTNGLLSVDVSVNTHSVTLEDFDLKQITTLTFDGKTLKPIDAPKLSGHHNSGILVFEAGDDVKDFTIIIEGIPTVEKRVFEWK